MFNNLVSILLYFFLFIDDADRLERANSYANDVERNPVGATKGGALADHGDFGYATRANESLRAKLVPLHGCSNSEASQLLNNRMSYYLTFS